MEQTYTELQISSFEALRKTESTVDALVKPEMARYILDYFNENNSRIIKRARVKTYRGYIQSGAWNPRISSVHFGADGNLQNGQHRLQAIAEEGVPVEVRFEFGMPEEAKDYHDLTSAGRTNADVMAQLGHSYPAAPSILLMFNSFLKGIDGRGGLGGAANVKNVLALYPDYPRLVAAAREVVGNFKRSELPGPTSRYVAAVALILSAGHPASRVEEYLSGIAGIGVGKNDVRRWTAQSVALDYTGLGSGGNSLAVKFLVYGFNRWIRGDSASRRFDTNIKLDFVLRYDPEAAAA